MKIHGVKIRIRDLIYGALLAPVIFAGLNGCLYVVEPGNQAVIEWKSK